MLRLIIIIQFKAERSDGRIVCEQRLLRYNPDMTRICHIIHRRIPKNYKGIILTVNFRCVDEIRFFWHVWWRIEYEEAEKRTQKIFNEIFCYWKLCFVMAIPHRDIPSLTHWHTLKYFKTFHNGTDNIKHAFQQFNKILYGILLNCVRGCNDRDNEKIESNQS